MKMPRTGALLAAAMRARGFNDLSDIREGIATIINRDESGRPYSVTFHFQMRDGSVLSIETAEHCDAIANASDHAVELVH